MQGSGRKVRAREAQLLVAALAASVLVSVVTTEVARAAVVVTFDVPGTHTWQVPAGVTEAIFEVFGAQGASGGSGLAGAQGGSATGTLAVVPGQKFQINVGGAGGSGVGGVNGGGSGFSPNQTDGGGGGGASDVRSGACASTATCGLAERIIVAGGGGGSSSGSSFTPDKVPGAGGGTSGGGAGGAGGGGGGTDTAGGGGGVSNIGACGSGMPGALGVGGDPGQNCGGGGGGGGYFGGGGGSFGSGGGGSGFIGSGFTVTSMNSDVQAGNGKVVITHPDPPPPSSGGSGGPPPPPPAPPPTTTPPPTAPPAPAGETELASTITIHHGSPFHGRVRSEVRPCRGHRKVTLIEEQGRSDLRIDKDWSNDWGRWSIGGFAHAEGGRFFAKAGRKTYLDENGTSVVCLPTRSRVLHIPLS